MNQFTVRYLDPTGQVDQLHKYICRCDKNFKDGLGLEKNKYYSTYTSICQSSGWGKSRIMRQLSALIPVLCLSYQQINSEEYPGRTEEAVAFLNLVVDKTKTNSKRRLTMNPFIDFFLLRKVSKSCWLQEESVVGQGRLLGACFTTCGTTKCEKSSEWINNYDVMIYSYTRIRADSG
jgi:hypothetical protein